MKQLQNPHLIVDRNSCHIKIAILFHIREMLRLTFLPPGAVFILCVIHVQVFNSEMNNNARKIIICSSSWSNK